MAGETAGAGQKSFLWKVRSNTAIVYILGSIHLAKPDMYPLPEKIEKSFAEAGVLALEADPAKAQDDKVLQQMLVSALYQEGETLNEHLSKENYELAEREMEKLGVPVETFIRTKPWFLAMTMETLELQRLGYDPAYGIDVYFAGKAAGKKRIIEIESFDYQIRLMNGFSDREQELFLLYTIKDLESLPNEINELMKAWRNGDTKTMERLVTRTFSESLELRPIYDKLIYKRNREMTTRIEQFLKGKETVFVVVGAAHLVGKEGIIELLKRKGFKLEQM
jgi:uncharacterized protein YbaP (TraB family)